MFLRLQFGLDTSVKQIFVAVFVCPSAPAVEPVAGYICIREIFLLHVIFKYVKMCQDEVLYGLFCEE